MKLLNRIENVEQHANDLFSYLNNWSCRTEKKEIFFHFNFQFEKKAL